MRSISSPRGSRKRTSSGREDVYPGKWLISCHGPVPKEAFISSRLSVITTYSPGSAGRSIPLTDPPPEPGEYVVITESLEEMKASFGTGPWHEMSHFPGYTSSLPDEVRFLDPLGELIERIPYNPGAWGGDEVSLERRSVRAPAGHPANWAESESDRKSTRLN